jgi:hypothetical protein
MQPLEFVREDPSTSDQHADKDKLVLDDLAVSSDSPSPREVLYSVAGAIKWPTVIDDPPTLGRLYIQHKDALEPLLREAFTSKSFKNIRRLSRSSLS